MSKALVVCVVLALGNIGIRSVVGYEPHMRAKIASSIAKGERRAQERRAVGRELCNRCRRPPVQCVCDSLPLEPIPTATDVLVLQHPNEFRKKSVSTVPLLSLVLQNVCVLVGESFGTGSGPVRDALSEGHRLLLLFPGEDAIDLDSPSWKGFNTDAFDARHPQSKTVDVGECKNTLILIDGTWTQAARMIRNSPTLLQCSQPVQFTSDSASIYNAIRREPKGHCLSTLEACAQALSLLEPDNDNVNVATEHLHAALQSLVKTQLLYNNASSASDPRFVGRTQKTMIKRRRSLELETDLFGPLSEDESCSEYNHTDITNPPVRKELREGIVLRSLETSDVPFVDSRWPYRSAKSFAMIHRQISADGGSCLGIDHNGKLCAFILRYQNGALGMLHVEEACRRRGYGAALLSEATRLLELRGDTLFAFIVDGNSASEALFAKQGWVKADPNVQRGTGRRRAKRKWVKPS